MADEVEPVIGHQDLPCDNHEAGHGLLRQRVIGLPGRDAASPLRIADSVLEVCLVQLSCMASISAIRACRRTVTGRRGCPHVVAGLRARTIGHRRPTGRVKTC